MRPLPSGDVLDAVLSKYRLSGMLFADSLGAGRRNDSYVIEDVEGARFVLRRYRRNPVMARIVFQLRFQKELKRRGFPTAEVIETTEGDLLVQLESGPWVLFSHVAGEEYDFGRLDQAAEAGRRLAQFHLVTKDIQLEDVPLDINPSLRRAWTHWEVDLDELRAEFIGDDIEEQLTVASRSRNELVASLPLDAFDTLPSGWAHGDYHGLNVVFAGAELRGLFDFDALYRGRYVEDIGYGLFMFGREFRGSHKIRSGAARAFLDGYCDTRPLLQSERDALALIAPLCWVGRGTYYAMLRRDGDEALVHFRRHMDTMRALWADRQRITGMVRRG